MTEAIETLEHNGCTIRILPDCDPIDPREDEGNLGTMCLFHNRHGVPNETDLRSSNYASWYAVEQAIRRQYNVVALLPVYGYDHSVFCMSSRIERGWFHYNFDGGRLGFIFATRERVKGLMGWTRITKERRAWLEGQLQNELETYTQYTNGWVYGYEVEGPDGEDLDSCWGFYGKEYAIEEAKAACPTVAETVN